MALVFACAVSPLSLHWLEHRQTQLTPPKTAPTMLFMTAAIRRYRRLVWTTSAGAWIVGWLLAAPAAAQWRNLPTGSVPLGADGKPDMSATAPRTPDGKPDLSGIYMPNMRYFQNLAADLGLENVPMTPEARKIHAARVTGLLGYEEPDAHCLPQGVPKINMAPVPFKIVQTDTLVVLVYEAFNMGPHIK